MFVLPTIFKSASFLLLLLTIAVSFWAWGDSKLLDACLLKPTRVWYHGEWWRVLTSGFVHKDYAHLGFNLFTFTFFGFEIERVCRLYFGRPMGAAAFLLVYVGGIVIANIPTVWRERQNPGYSSLGASGGVAAVLFASIVLSPLRKLSLLFIPVGVPGFIFGALYAAFSFVQARRQAADGINHEAHLTGALYGFAVILLLLPHTGAECLTQISGWFQAVLTGQ
ncbi:MAG: rhomboid family intramembrane serine protease [Hymenobacteraceae bacterium]|nr:rhomboid family intramembrane serine protease [Hymenobacteraceae bacterium]